MAIKFFWNGVKENGGKLVRCSYDMGHYANFPAGTITLYAKDYGIDGHFGPEMAEAFKVENDTDSQTDYFETDRIRVRPDHPLYAEVRAAMEKRKAHYDRRAA